MREGQRVFQDSRTLNAVKEAGHDEDKATKESMRISGNTWSGIKHGSTYCGHLPVPLGALVYQLEGQRLLAVADAMDIMGHMPEMPDEVTPEMGPDLVRVTWLYHLDLE